MEYRRYVETIYAFQFIINGAFSVDTFFFISGFLVSFIYFRSNAKGKLEKLSKGLNEFSAGTLHFIGLLAYRFIRLTVPYMYMLGVVAVVMRYLAHESVFDMPANDAENCPKYWWRNIFYINTLFPVKDMVSFHIFCYVNKGNSKPFFSSACYGVGIWLMILNSTSLVPSS